MQFVSGARTCHVSATKISSLARPIITCSDCSPRNRLLATGNWSKEHSGRWIPSARALLTLTHRIAMGCGASAHAPTKAAYEEAPPIHGVAASEASGGMTTAADLKARPPTPPIDTPESSLLLQSEKPDSSLLLQRGPEPPPSVAPRPDPRHRSSLDPERPTAGRRRSSVDDFEVRLLERKEADDKVGGLRKSVKHRRRSSSWGPGDFESWSQSGGLREASFSLKKRERADAPQLSGGSIFSSVGITAAPSPD